jgi:ubiquinone/menaquinone biosynthesis C-methylase UbiE
MPDDLDDQKQWLAGVFDRAAPTYDSVGDAYHDHFGRRLVEVAGVGSGASVLDVACGRGAVLLPATAAAGPSGRVVGVDLSPEMVQLARDALANAELRAVDVRVMDAEHLEFSDAEFDYVACAFGVFFFPHPEQAAAEFLRVARPGGTVALSSWTGDDPRWSWEDELLRDVSVERRAISRAFDEAADLEALLRGVGFDDEGTHVEHRDIVFASEDEWWAWKWSFSVRGILEQMDTDARDVYRSAAYEAMQPMREPAGFPMRLSAALVFGRKPA